MSISVSLRKSDSRCRGWHKVIRAGAALPLPEHCNGAESIPAPYHREGDEEIFDGDFVFYGEANHHTKQRGWTYRIGVPVGDKIVWCKPTAEHKARAKALGLDPTLLPGSGETAAMIRIAHAVRAFGHDAILGE